MKSNSAQYKYIAAIAVVGVLLVALGFGVLSQEESQLEALTKPIIPQVDFKFDVYCPIGSATQLKAINSALGYSTKALGFDFKTHNQVYVVIAKAEPEDSKDPKSPGKLYYCGIARKWADKNCDNAQLECSIPGPMFYFPVEQQATIIFVNDISSKGLNWTKTDCYADDSDDEFCKVTTKKIKPGCSYPDPTDYSVWKTAKHRINSEAVPMSAHIHGLETRPTFDGNPLGWYNTRGDTGPGFNSLFEDSYYSQFNNPDEVKSWLVMPSELVKRSKVVRAPNDQLPGMLFYHDHAMKSTLYNVQNGFSGIYIIYDIKVQTILPTANFQKFVLFAKPGDARMFVSPNKAGGTQNILDQGTYRIRMINAHFDNVYENVSFCAYYEAVKDDEGKTIYIEYDPTSSPDYDLTSHQHKIPFSVIGTDTTVFHEAVGDIEQVTMGSAERVDILIDFHSQLPPGIEYVYIICYDTNEGEIVMKHRFSLPWVDSSLNTEDKVVSDLEFGGASLQNLDKVNNLAKNDEKMTYLNDPNFRKNVKIDVPFIDLSLLPDQKIAVKRHRPLFSLPFDQKFMIGAHYMFEMGASDSPQIGTFEDFYMVNTLWEPHPMHIHLINFQTVATYSLKSIPENEKCTLYMLDYFRLTGLSELQLSNADLCDYLWNLNAPQVDSLFQKMGNYSLENITIDRNSGLDTMAHFDGDSRYLVQGCEWDKVYKYLCGNTTSHIPVYQRRWKDTFLVPAYTVAVFRVRWASTGYEPEKKLYPYFQIPEDQLVEFPGFVYHCHILPHEDNEMMRPFVLRYSDQYLRRFSEFKRQGSCTGRTWLQTVTCINSKLGCSS